MPIELPKAYDPKESQEKWLTHWEEKKYFHADPSKSGESYTIVIPPPNVTGALHMGHALNNTLQDVLIRWRRMQGRNALWVPGTDHAGIATQAVVERLLLQTEKKTRHDLGREAMVTKIWEWKDKYEKRILGQLREMGASCDWSRTRFTLDPMCANAVRETFFRMFRDGYIYRGKRLVNWDAQLQTSVADDETYTENTKGGFWTFQYRVIGETDTFIQFSTTRPETMLGDSALCVHPSDERYKHLIGKKVLQPHTGREIPIIADGLLADPELGTGCVKVTPAHDPNDYACWQRHPEIEIINILNPDGTITSGFGEYSGLDRPKAREAVSKKMEELGLFIEKAERDIPLPYSDRSKTPIEPFLSDQWFVKMGDWADNSKQGLAQLALDAVTGGRIKFFPERYSKTYTDWLGEKRDWCISRQLWWGHQIPIWYKDEENTTGIPKGLEGLAREKLERLSIQYNAEAKRFLVCVAPNAEDLEKLLESNGFTRDADVLDTWFSSALWPHSTLGWPESTPDLAKYYPTSTLCTSRDIITLWVARMVLTGLYNVGNIPFHHVYVHPVIQDGFGDRMSKSRGNGVDPLDSIELYGTDAMRFLMVSLAGDTQDCRLPVSNVCPHCGHLNPLKKENTHPDETKRPKKISCSSCKQQFRPGGPWTTEDPNLQTAKQASERFEIGRNFANKLWNATRFILMNLEGYSAASVEPSQLAIEDRWILSRLATTAKAVTNALESYKFAEVSKLVYEFAWSEFCDWYIEMSKSRRSDPVCQRVLVGVLDGILRLAHPVMPFVSESLWHYLNEAAPERGLPSPAKSSESVCIAKWPEYPSTCIDTSTEVSIARMQELIRGVREIRNRYMIDDKTQLQLTVRCTDNIGKEFDALTTFIKALGGIEKLTLGSSVSKPKQPATQVNPEFEAYISLEGLIDIPTELKRLEKQIAEKTKQVTTIQSKLANADFVAKAPADVVASQKESVQDLTKQIALLESTMTDLKAG